MNRLTMESDKGGLAFTFDLDVTCKKEEILKIFKIGNALKAYEDLGLTPEQIREVDRLYSEKCKEVAELQKSPWIPATERLPISKGWYQVFRKGHNHAEDGYFKGKTWSFGKEYGEVIAWMPLPEPYTESVKK